MTQAEEIISMFGGVTEMSRKLGHKHPTTVAGWKKRGFIPSKQQQTVLTAGHKFQIPVMPDHFFSSRDLQ